MIMDDIAREAFKNEDWGIVKEYIEFLEEKEARLGKMESALNKMETDKGNEAVLTKYFSEFKQK